MSAKTPWEETWSVHPLDSRCVVDKAERVIADIRAPLHENGREASAFISAAPDMARAIMALLSDDGHTPECGHNGTGVFASDYECSEECRGARAALRKAGVIE